MKSLTKYQALKPSVFKQDGWKMFPKSSSNDGTWHAFELSVWEDGGETVYELIYWTQNLYAVIYKTYDRETPISERLFLFRGTLASVSDYKTIMRLCEISKCN